MRVDSDVASRAKSRAAQTNYLCGPNAMSSTALPNTTAVWRRSYALNCSLAVALLLLVGCKTPRTSCDPHFVSHQLQSRTGIAPEMVKPGCEVIPAGVSLTDGLSEDEAVQTALANNSAFQATLAQLGMAGGDVVQANLIANPQLLIYFPTGIKEGQYTLFSPIESYLLRPTRVKIANREYRRVGEQLVQNGLNLARDVRLAYADYAVASQQASLAQEALELRSRIAQLTDRRLDRGDISELESTTADVDKLNASAAASFQQYTVSIAEAKLISLIGLPMLNAPLVPLPLQIPDPISIDEAQLIDQALACRPDYHAACWAVAAASQRSHLARWIFLLFDGVLDVRTGFGDVRTGGGLRASLPIFNRNQGGILRADWEVNAAIHARDAIRDQIVMEVRMAARQLRQAQQNLAILTNDVAPALVDAVSIAEKGFADGGTEYLLVLQTSSQYLDVRARILDQTAACQKALAELERSVGSCLDGPPMDLPGLLQQTTPPADLTGQLSDPVLIDDETSELHL